MPTYLHALRAKKRFRLHSLINYTELRLGRSDARLRGLNSSRPGIPDKHRLNAASFCSDCSFDLKTVLCGNWLCVDAGDGRATWF